ncbi:hypothetical protein [Spirillospora sp. NPDC048819]
MMVKAAFAYLLAAQATCPSTDGARSFGALLDDASGAVTPA